MENLEIRDTEYTPYIFFNAETRKLIIRGNSFPENTFDFYKNAILWLKNFFVNQSNQKTLLEIEINYFNSSSSQLFFQLFDMLADAVTDGHNIEIHWLYRLNNSSAEETGEDFVSEYKNLNIKIITKD